MPPMSDSILSCDFDEGPAYSRIPDVKIDHVEVLH